MQFLVSFLINNLFAFCTISEKEDQLGSRTSLASVQSSTSAQHSECLVILLVFYLVKESWHSTNTTYCGVFVASIGSKALI